MRRDSSAVEGHDDAVDDFVLATNEVVAAALTEGRQGPGPSIDVRWSLRSQPHPELFSEVRNAEGTPDQLVGSGMVANLLDHYADRVEIDERIGGSVITVRIRV